MKYPYYFEYIVDTLTLRLPKDIEMLSDFIGQIATEDLANELIEAIDSVQNGDKDEVEIMINVPSVSSTCRGPPRRRLTGMRSIRGARWCWNRACPVGSQSSRSMAGGRCLWGLGARPGRGQQPGSAASAAVGAGHHGVFTTEWSCGYETPAQPSAPGGGALLVGCQLLL